MDNLELQHAKPDTQRLVTSKVRRCGISTGHRGAGGRRHMFTPDGLSMTAAYAGLQDQPQGAPFGEFLAHMHARRRGARWIFGAVSVGALAVAAILPSSYRATASLAIMPSPEFTVREEAGSRAFNNSALAMDQIMKAETEILESDALHEGAIFDLARPAERSHTPGSSTGVEYLYPDLSPDEAGGAIWRGIRASVHFALSPWRGHSSSAEGAELDQALRRFSNNLRVLPAKESNVISISFTHPNSEMAAHALNVMLTRYASRRQFIYNDPQLAVAQHAADDAAGLVRRADLALSAFKAEHGYSDYETERDLLLRRRSQAEQVISDANAADMQAQARLTTLDAEIRRLPAKLGLYREDDTDARLQSVTDKLLDLNGQLAAARVHYQDSSRVIKTLQSQITLQQKAKRLMSQDGTPSLSRTGRSPALDPLVVDRAHAMADRDVARVQSDIVRQQVKDLADRLRTLNVDESIFIDLKRQKIAADESFVAASRAAAEQRLTEAEDSRRLANVRIIQPARVPQYPTTTKLIICAAGFLLGMMLACCWLLLKFVTDTTFLTAPGLATATGFPVLAVFQKTRLPAHAERA